MLLQNQLSNTKRDAVGKVENQKTDSEMQTYFFCRGSLRVFLTHLFREFRRFSKGPIPPVTFANCARPSHFQSACPLWADSAIAQPLRGTELRPRLLTRRQGSQTKCSTTLVLTTVVVSNSRVRTDASFGLFSLDGFSSACLALPGLQPLSMPLLQLEVGVRSIDVSASPPFHAHRIVHRAMVSNVSSLFKQLRFASVSRCTACLSPGSSLLDPWVPD